MLRRRSGRRSAASLPNGEELDGDHGDFGTAIEAPRDAVGANARVDIHRAFLGQEKAEIVRTDAVWQGDRAVTGDANLSAMRMSGHDPIVMMAVQVVDGFRVMREQKAPPNRARLSCGYAFQAHAGQFEIVLGQDNTLTH